MYLTLLAYACNQHKEGLVDQANEVLVEVSYK